jgi:DNA polymerase III alpha subunit (gram-positive type)
MNRHLSRSLTNEKICTRKLANRIFPDLYSKKLSVLCEFLDIKSDGYHMAMADATYTQIMFDKFLDILEKKGIKTLDELLIFESSKK